MGKSRVVVGAAVMAALAAMTVAVAQGATHSAGSDKVTKLRGVSLELVGQVRNSAPGVSPATSIQYGYISQLGDLPIFSAQPPSESTALLTFYTDTTTSQVLNDGPIRVVNRQGTMTIYSDPTANASFADPDSFRDGVAVLVAHVQQQVILDTVTGAFTAHNFNTILSTNAFQCPERRLQLGKVHETFTTAISGHVNAAAPPSAFMAGSTSAIGDSRGGWDD